MARGTSVRNAWVRRQAALASRRSQPRREVPELGSGLAALCKDPSRSRCFGSLHRPRCAVLFVAAFLAMAFPHAMGMAADPEGVWLMDGEVAVQIFDCGGLLRWLQIPRDPEGRLNRDDKNPDPRLRRRGLCGLTIIWGLHSTGPGSWGGGWLYNPDDGKTYNLSAELTFANLMVARVYRGLPLFGETKSLVRVPHGTSNGWC